ncbi:MAG TPA: HPP family protein [Candidatus Sulfotelmatobacter sp.]|jgi:CBS-domain-containing membrane protein|nr:HPP family protein [Candidatus Sulfotelmatobacter sp.]
MRKNLQSYFNRMRGGGARPPSPPLRHVGWSLVGGGFAIGIVAALSSATGQPWLMAPFGASCVLAFGLPDSPLAQPRSIVGGHVLSALVGLVCVGLFGPVWWAMGVSVALSIAVMQLTGTTHAPAGANPLLAMSGALNWHGLLTPVLAGSLALVACALLFNNLARERAYPRYWL